MPTAKKPLTGANAPSQSTAAKTTEVIASSPVAAANTTPVNSAAISGKKTKRNGSLRTV
jgi:hypothetical protein